MRLIETSLRRRVIDQHRVIIIGQNKTSEILINFFQKNKKLGFFLIGTFATFNDEIAEQILSLKSKKGVDEIILADPEASRELAAKLLTFSDAEQLGFFFSADLFTAAVGRSAIHMFAGIPVIEVRKTPLDGWGAIYKRLYDVVISLILIIITLPIQIVVAICLFVEQPGRILFSRLPDGKKTTRIGQGGVPFHYFKFRSMVKNAHTLRSDPAFIKKYGNLRAGSPLFKLKDDPRVTRVGAFIRRYSLDELPEFYLVLFGRMSLVGPRPHLPEEVAKYQPLEHKVLTIKPGITGLAQISGRADLDFNDEVRLDTHYIEHWSPWLDLYIMLKTPLAVIFRKGAY